MLKVITAPLAGYTDEAFRRVLRDLGADLCYTEMVSAQGLCYGNVKTWDYISFKDWDHPVGLQLFGKDPQMMKKAIRLLEERASYEYLDLNMGCPVPKIVKNGEGSALMKDLDLAKAVVSAMVETSTRPVSVKIRLGIDEDHLNGVEVAKALAPLGISHLTVHGRTAKQFYSGRANWDKIREIAQAVEIPVIGNGDIFTAEQAKDKLENYGVSGIMLGRGILGNPFLVKDIQDTLAGRVPQSQHDYKSTMLKHLAYMVELKGEHRACVEFRKHALSYLKGRPYATYYKRMIMDLETYEDWDNLLDLQTPCLGG